MMLHAKFGNPRLYCLSQEDIYSLHYISLCKTFDPPEWGQFLPPQGHDLNILGRGPLDDAPYQIS